jgi:hypothetical protein
LGVRFDPADVALLKENASFGAILAADVESEGSPKVS